MDRRAAGFRLAGAASGLMLAAPNMWGVLAPMQAAALGPILYFNAAVRARRSVVLLAGMYMGLAYTVPQIFYLCMPPVITVILLVYFTALMVAMAAGWRVIAGRDTVWAAVAAGAFFAVMDFVNMRALPMWGRVAVVCAMLVAVSEGDRVRIGDRAGGYCVCIGDAAGVCGRGDGATACEAWVHGGGGDCTCSGHWAERGGGARHMGEPYQGGRHRLAEQRFGGLSRRALGGGFRSAFREAGCRGGGTRRTADRFRRDGFFPGPADARRVAEAFRGDEPAVWRDVGRGLF